MTTEPEIRALLDDLHTLTTMLAAALTDSGLPAASGSGNGGKAPKGGRSKLPCSTDLLTMQNDIGDRVEPIAANLANDLTIHGRPFGARPPAWVKWLHRHRVDLINRPWWPDVEEELHAIRRELADQFTPPEPIRPKLPDFATAEELATATGRSVAAIHRWCGRHLVETYIIGGVKHYKTSTVLSP